MQTKNITCKLNIVHVYSILCYFCEHNRLSLSSVAAPGLLKFRAASRDHDLSSGNDFIVTRCLVGFL